MKKLLLAIAFIGFIATSSFASTNTLVSSFETELCEDKDCDKKSCKKGDKKSCKKGDKKACCSKDKAKSCKKGKEKASTSKEKAKNNVSKTVKQETK